jgi:hypothetical protein
MNLFGLLTGFSNENSLKFWHTLILSTGHIDSISDLSPYQVNYLEKIRSKYPEIKSKLFSKAKRILDEYYQDRTELQEIELSGLNLPDEGSEVWELYFECTGKDKNGDEKYFVPIVILEEFEITGESGVS